MPIKLRNVKVLGKLQDSSTGIRHENDSKIGGNKLNYMTSCIILRNRRRGIAYESAKGYFTRSI